MRMESDEVRDNEQKKLFYVLLPGEVLQIFLTSQIVSSIVPHPSAFSPFLHLVLALLFAAWLLLLEAVLTLCTCQLTA